MPFNPDPTKAITYSSYLCVDELLALQHPESTEHDEMLFIVIHQVYELWFKQFLHELDFLGERFELGHTARALHTLKRLRAILKTVVAQVDVLETMTPLEFSSFRDRLGSSSGFQSYQFKELEFLLGYKRAAVLNVYPEDSEGRRRLEQRLAASTLWDSFLSLLVHRGYAVPEDQRTRDVREPVQPSPALQDILIDIYKHDSPLAAICERLVDLDEGLQEWRYRHVKMVERTIGHKMGTGGSPGVSYLLTTLKPIFPDLWEIRTQF